MSYVRDTSPSKLCSSLYLVVIYTCARWQRPIAIVTKERYPGLIEEYTHIVIKTNPPKFISPVFIQKVTYL